MIKVKQDGVSKRYFDNYYEIVISLIIQINKVNDMKESEDNNLIFEETRYKITPEGSNFYNCTPKILGPQYDRILSLVFSKMMIVGIEVNYYMHSWDGVSVPCLTLLFRSPGTNGEIHFSIECKMEWFPPDCSRSIEVKPLPDINALTPFSEKYCPMEIEFIWHDLDPDNNSDYCQQYFWTSLSLFNNDKKTVIDCFRVSFSFED
jgi:hypothetical protein